MPQTTHIRPHAPVAERVLLPGDPGRALRLAQILTEGPKMLNHNRGLWGYTGMAPDGEPLTIQATGMGGPSAAIVIHELLELGARRLIRVGTCGALDGSLALGDVIVAEAALKADGTSRALAPHTDVAHPDQGLTEALIGLDLPARLVATADLFYDPEEQRAAGWLAAGAVAVEMEAATVFEVATRARVPAACVLAVTDIVSTRERIGEEELHAAEEQLGRAAFSVLSSPSA